MIDPDGGPSGQGDHVLVGQVLERILVGFPGHHLKMTEKRKRSEFGIHENVADPFFREKKSDSSE